MLEREVTYSGFWRRVVAHWIDAFIAGFAVMPFFAVFVGGAAVTESEGAKAFGVLTYCVCALVLPFLYHAAFEASRYQASLGKKAMGLKVVTENGQKLSFGTALGRNFGKILSSIIFGLGFLMAAFSGRKQALHDKLAGTLVVKVVDKNVSFSIPSVQV